MQKWKSQQNRVTYTPLVDRFLSDPDLNLVQATVFGLIGRLSYSKGYCYASIPDLAGLIKVSEPELVQAIGFLKQRKYIALMPSFDLDEEGRFVRRGMNIYVCRHWATWFQLWNLNEHARQEFASKVVDAWKSDCRIHNDAVENERRRIDSSIVEDSLRGYLPTIDEQSLFSGF